MAQVTNQEYQNASNAMNDRYTSDSIQSYKDAYNNYMSQWMSSSEAANKARWLLVENTPTQPTQTSNTANWYQNQWAWNYVYNPVTEMYENQSSNSNQNTNTPINQQQNTVSTVTENTQSGAMKPLSQEYYNQTSDEALNTIRNNLNNYRQTNPEYFTNYDSFKRNFSYDSRNDEQKNLLDEWYKWYTQQLQLSSVPTTDLYTQYKDGQISATELEWLRISNPEKYAELMNQINKWNIVSAYDDDKWADTTGMNIQDMAYQMAAQIFTKFMSWDTTTEATQYFRDLEEKMNSPEMMEIQDKTTDLQEQIENINDDRARIKKEVEEEYAGTGATRSKINAIIADRSYELDLQLRTLNSEYNKYATQYNNRVQQYQNEFQLQLQEYQVNMQARQQQMDELWFALDLMNFETNEQKAEREWNYRVKQQEYENWNINSKDYDTRYKAALKSVQNLLSQYPWIPTQRSAEQMAQDILTAIDGWSNLGAELTKINKFMQEKPEYKYLYNQTYKPAASAWVQSYKVWDTEYVVYNGEMMTADDFNKRYGGKAAWATGTAKQYDLIDSRAMSNSSMSTVWWYDGNTLGLFLLDSKHQVGKKWWQCGKFVNDYLQFIGLNTPGGRYYDNDLSTKLNSVNTHIPTEWAIAVFDYNHKSSDWINHWHVGIVTKVYEDWSFDMIDSNGDLNKPETIRKIHINGSSALKWFFDPSKLPAWSGLDWWMSTLASNTTTLSSVDEAKKQNYLEEARRWRISQTNTVQIGDLAAEQWWGDEWRAALNQWLKTNLTDTQIKMMNQSDSAFSSNAIVKEFESAINQMQQLQVALNDTSWVWDMSAIFTFMKTLDPSSVVRESEFNSAAATAWVLNPSAIWQKLEKNINWEFLTPQQREDFKKIAKQFIKVKAQNYQIKYDELLNRYDNYWIDRNLAPTNMADAILSQLWMWTSTPAVSWNRWTPLVSTSYTTSWAGNTSSTVNLWWWYVPTSLYWN